MISFVRRMDKMTGARKWAALFLLSMFAANTNAQTTRNSGWASVISNIRTGQKTSIFFDAQIRTTDEWQGTETTILRPGFSYATSKRSLLTAGVAFIRILRKADGVSDRVSDNRFWQQLIINQPIGINSLQHRLRLEERTIPVLYAVENELRKKDGKINVRFRYFNRYASGFHKGVKLDKGVYWVVQNEFFFNWLGAKPANGKFFDQTRTYAGLGWRTSKKVDIEWGYMLQHVEGREKTYTNNHILQLSSILRL